MVRILYDAAVIFLSVFVGLSALWTVLRIMPLSQRLISAGIAGGVSAFASLIIMSVAAA